MKLGVTEYGSDSSICLVVWCICVQLVVLMH